MKSATVHQIKQELSGYSQADLVQLILRLSKFKKDNKELLTYLLYEADDEKAYIQSIKEEVESHFSEINTNSFYLIKKSIRKILRLLKKYIRYSGNKETEAELLLHFCRQLLDLKPSIKSNTVLMNTFERQLALAEKAILSLHEDLQFDYTPQLEELRN